MLMESKVYETYCSVACIEHIKDLNMYIIIVEEKTRNIYFLQTSDSSPRLQLG